MNIYRIDENFQVIRDIWKKICLNSNFNNGNHFHPLLVNSFQIIDPSDSLIASAVRKIQWFLANNRIGNKEKTPKRNNNYSRRFNCCPVFFLLYSISSRMKNKTVSFYEPDRARYRFTLHISTRQSKYKIRRWEWRKKRSRSNCR